MGCVEDEAPFAMSFGEWLRGQRKKRHMTQAELARLVHCATVTIRKIEANERRPSRQLAELLAERLEFAAPAHFFAGRSAVKRESIPRPQHVQARTAYLLNASTDQLLFAERAQQRLAIASTTKIMTALIAIEQGDLEQQVSIKQETVELINRYHGHSSHLHAGDTIHFKDLLYALMLPSGDDAAFVLAEALCGSVREFVKLMHVYARRLRLTDTNYVNPSGIACLNMLEDYETRNYSTATDLVRLTQYAITNPLFAQIVQLQRYDLPLTPAHHAYRWETVNHLLYSYAGATGVKTGKDSETDCSMVFSATSGRHQLIGVVLQEKSIQQRLLDAKYLLDWGFAQSAR
jgi:D-alanyl-D-alanine carboxypeptidase (penicillin-binding protein 5/6)